MLSQIPGAMLFGMLSKEEEEEEEEGREGRARDTAIGMNTSGMPGLSHHCTGAGMKVNSETPGDQSNQHSSN